LKTTVLSARVINERVLARIAMQSFQSSLARRCIHGVRVSRWAIREWLQAKIDREAL
jgi:hypothetical protein